MKRSIRDDGIGSVILVLCEHNHFELHFLCHFTMFQHDPQKVFDYCYISIKTPLHNNVILS